MSWSFGEQESIAVTARESKINRTVWQADEPSPFVHRMPILQPSRFGAHRYHGKRIGDDRHCRLIWNPPKSRLGRRRSNVPERSQIVPYVQGLNCTPSRAMWNIARSRFSTGSACYHHAIQLRTHSTTKSICRRHICIFPSSVKKFCRPAGGLDNHIRRKKFLLISGISAILQQLCTPPARIANACRIFLFTDHKKGFDFAFVVPTASEGNSPHVFQPPVQGPSGTSRECVSH